MQRFLQRSLQEIMKKIILGTSAAWSMSRLAHQPSDPAYYIEDHTIIAARLKLSKLLSHQTLMYSIISTGFIAPDCYLSFESSIM